MPPDYWKIVKKQHFTCSNLTLFIVPFFLFLFFLFFSLFSFFFFFFSFSLGATAPSSPPKWRPCSRMNSHLSTNSLFLPFSPGPLVQKESPVAVLMIKRWDWSHFLRISIRFRKIGGGCLSPVARVHNSRWRPRWPPTPICSIISGSINDREVI